MIPIHVAPRRFPSSLRGVSPALRHALFRALSTVSGTPGSGVCESSDAHSRAFSTNPRLHEDYAPSIKQYKVRTPTVRAERLPPLPRPAELQAQHEKWFTVDDLKAVPGLCPDGAIRSLPQLNLTNCTKQALQDYFVNSWAMTESLLSCLRDEDSFTKPPYHELRHPMVKKIPLSCLDSL